MLSSRFLNDMKNLPYRKVFVIFKFLLLQNTFKVVLQYIFNSVTHLTNVLYFKLNFKLKVDQKMCTYKNLVEFLRNQWPP